MSARLQRLLSRAAPGPGPAGAGDLVPVAPLTSPLAAYDQRLGLPDYEPLVPADLGDSGPADPGQEEAAGPHPRSARPSPRDRPVSPARHAVDLHIVSDAREASKPSKPAAPREGRQVSTDEPRPTFVRNPLAITPDELEPALSPRKAEPDPLPASDVPGEIEAAEPPSAPPARSPLSQPPSEESPLDSEVANALPDSRPSVHESDAAIPLPSDPGPIEAGEVELPKPRRAQLPVAYEPAIEEPVDRRDGRGLEEGPALVEEPAQARSVTIGQIVIDVREPAQAPQAELRQPSPPPVTAAAASVIGPLPIRPSAISLFGMRRR